MNQEFKDRYIPSPLNVKPSESVEEAYSRWFDEFEKKNRAFGEHEYYDYKKTSIETTTLGAHVEMIRIGSLCGSLASLAAYYESHQNLLIIHSELMKPSPDFNLIISLAMKIATASAFEQLRHNERDIFSGLKQRDSAKRATAAKRVTDQEWALRKQQAHQALLNVQDSHPHMNLTDQKKLAAKGMCPPISARSFDDWLRGSPKKISK